MSQLRWIRVVFIQDRVSISCFSIIEAILSVKYEYTSELPW